MKFKFIVGVVAILLITIISAQGTIENIAFIDAPEDFIAGSDLDFSFEFDYPDSNSENGLLVIVINVSSNDSEYPVWENDFSLEGEMENLVNTILPIEVRHDYELECTEDDHTLNYPYGVVEVNGTPGVFYCTNNDFLEMDIGTANEVEMTLRSNPALYPGDYNIEIGLFYPEKLVSDLELFVNSPLEQIYNQRRFSVNVSTNIIVEEIEYIEWWDNNPRWRRLCRNCDEYGMFRNKKKSFNQGWNNVSFKATDFLGFSVEKNVLFFVDSRNPDIDKTYPRRGFADGNFIVEFEELNPVNLTIFYGNDSQQIDINLSCVQDERHEDEYECNFFVNLSEYNNKEIEYYVYLEDIAGNFDISRERDIQIDMTDPIINEINFTIDRKRVEFEINITELNFDGVYYIDWNDRRPRERRLCRRLDDDGICSKKKTFRYGEHNLTIIALDGAFNNATENLFFEIIKA